MIVLDTNVLSEVFKPVASQDVLRWLARQDRERMYTTSISQAEVLYGLEILPEGRRKSGLYRSIENLFKEQFPSRILAFDEASARVFPKIVAGRRAMGRPISKFDAMVASICRSVDAPVATRNTKDFEHCGVTIVDPWRE